MKNKLLLSILLLSSLSAQATVLENFESYEVGTNITLWSYWGGTPSGTGVVEKDPANANNKVLHITISNWGNFFGVKLPEDLSGANLSKKADYVNFRVYRLSTDQNEWKKIQIYQDKDLVYEDDGYPSQGAIGTWQNRSYPIPSDFSSNGTTLALGFNSDASDYLIDDIVVKGEYDDYRTVVNDTIDISGQNSSSDYKSYGTPLIVPKDASVTFLTARYSYLYPTVIGEGRMNICSGGERTFIGNSNKSYPNWLSFRGNVHLYPYTKFSSGNGFYGLVLMHNGKVMAPETAQADAEDGKMNTCFSHSSLTMHKGTTLAIEGSDKNRGARIGELQMEEGSTLTGYYKSKADANSYYLIGGNNTDAVLAGKIAPQSASNMKLGLIKEGTGTYRLTGTGSQITGGVRIVRGRVLFNSNVSVSEVNVLQQASVGGTGTIAGTANVYGIMQPGDNGVGHLTIGSNAKLIVRPTARLEFQIASASDYDQLTVQGPVSYYHINQDFAVSDSMPRLRIQLVEGADLKVGDEFVLLTATGKQSYEDVAWQFDVRYPKSYTWAVEQNVTNEGLTVVARVTSLDYSGQGDVADSDNLDGDVSTDDGTFDLMAEKQETTSLRHYADKIQKFVGTCVPVWSLDLNNESSPRTKMIAEQFNAVVAENEMKFDATEPNRGQFSFDAGDQLVNFARKHNMYIRGHALAWHSQVPGWLTSDGGKNSNNFSRTELLAILKNHIVNVMGRWKGKIQEWDVANEVLDDNQYSINSNPKAYDLRPSVWATGIGEDFLDSAFVWAHQVDPEAKLILNDYGVEGKGWGKSEALYNLAMRLRNSGIPIDGVGLQSHMDAGLNYIGSIEQNIARYQSAGLLCRITELDLAIGGNTQPQLEQQGNDYYRLARIAMKYPNCGILMIWGLADDMTWRNGTRPLLFDASNKPKPAYWGVHAALRQASGEELNIEETEIITSSPFNTSTEVYNLQGQRTLRVRPGELYFQRGRKFIVR